MTGFVPFVCGIVAVAVQYNACEVHARLGTLSRHAKRACRSVGARLQQHKLAAGAKLHAGRSCKFLCPFLERLVRGFHSTNTSRQEKFLTIRWLLTGERSSGVNVSENFVARLKQLFSRLQDPFTQIVKPCRARYSFLNYNFVFRRLFDLLGAPHLGRNFPPLKSRRKREDIIQLWLCICIALKWPYVNSDEKLFGAEHACRISTILSRRGHLSEQLRARIAAYPTHANYGLSRF